MVKKKIAGKSTLVKKLKRAHKAKVVRKLVSVPKIAKKMVQHTKSSTKNTQSIPERLEMKANAKKKSPTKGSKGTVKEKKASVVVDTMKIVGSRDIAYDFGLKVYKKFDQIVKSIVLFGSGAKKSGGEGSDIDVLIIIDDVAINWDEELIAWYREELGKVVQANPYIRPIHVSTVKLSTWWDDVMRGDPTAINVIRYGESLVDFGGFFNPLKVLLQQGKIKSTPESIYTLLQRAPHHTIRARQSVLAAVDGLYWTMVDCAHAVLISAEITPPSPEDIPEILMKAFVKSGRLDKKYVYYYDEVHTLAKGIIHGKVTVVSGKEIDELFEKSDLFLREMARLVKELIEERDKKEREEMNN